MSRARRLRRQNLQVAAPQALPVENSEPVRHAPLWLAAAFLLPNLGALACGFVFDDRIVLVENNALHVHSLAQLAHIWKSGYWPDNRGLELYRPVAQTVWALLWAAGGSSHAAIFHALGLALGLAVVLLLYRLLLRVKTPPGVAFLAAALFALFPIHTDATTSVVGSAELMAAAFGLAAVILYYRGRPVGALALFALAVFSKESAAAFAALPLAFPHKRPRLRDSWLPAIGAAAVIGIALIAHNILSRSSQIPPIDNPTSLVDAGKRWITALWVQCLYLYKALVPVHLSADYSYKQIRLVMGLGDWRAWAGLGLAAAAIYAAWKRPAYRAPLLAYAILFAPTANLVFPIGTIMGERLMYAPSLGLALLLAVLLARSRFWKPVLIAVGLIFGARTAVRNLDWLNAPRFYNKLVETSPDSAKAHYSIGVEYAADGDDNRAIGEYDRAVAIFPAYAEAYRNRGNALARLGRRAEAIASYQQALRFDPGDFAANSNLQELQAGHTIYPPRAKM
ncbi:MAG TPA: tetratricopeptide repeat protein [Bryobacteraceae bacterium]|nr:tetratricopeptide repeat protein [Bryobacteraceae bacterium]